MIMTFYEKKAEFHHAQWQAALDDNKEKAAAHHMQEYLNYLQMISNQVAI